MSVRDTYRILECINLTELNALSDNNKELLRLIVSAKVVEIEDGSWIKERLWLMFPENSITGAKLRDYRYGLVPGPYVPNPD